MSLRAVELFGGAGGLAIGTHKAGFSSELFVEWDKWACDTVRENSRAGHPLVKDWAVHQGDVRKVDYSTLRQKIDLVAGGPPCQPFSMGGKARAADDSRDMFPAAAEVVRNLRPRALLFENVRGLKRAAFANYFEFIKLRMKFPELSAHVNESWTDHYARLQKEYTSSGSNSLLSYNVVDHLVNAADYGVPQHRHRVFIVGFRNDVKADWSFPEATHSEDALLQSQWISGEYWEEHKIAKKNRPEIDPRKMNRVNKIRNGEIEVAGHRWRTVRDALSGMPEPKTNGFRGWKNHKLQEGAKSYPGHTGSPLDQPSKALKAGGHGVPGGENMLRRVDGSVRYFSIREAARIQTFPDDYELHGSWGEAMRQLGNAVPVKLAEAVASSIATHLNLATIETEETKFVR
ncbi:DNA cytosine methyltransferase [Glutamicibacter soli]|uniref:DNA cytosine methyltransferase n=1 Tax=Glutamicibacter soli TaxID=453836 RepID=UPI001929A804|nr:DNA cytosine methyltransferase [Glutamicibacter soli]